MLPLSTRLRGKKAAKSAAGEIGKSIWALGERQADLDAPWLRSLQRAWFH
jgi:hypothetical protein